jgi:Golgi nucleoside diphosphatase
MPPHKPTCRVQRHRHARTADLYDRVETQPGLDRFADDPAGLERQALGPLLEWAREVVPREQHGATPLYLLATAGVRRLPDEKQVCGHCLEAA